jgi:hypothetical protein
MLLIGSRAAKILYPNARDAHRDWDILAFYPDVIKWVDQNKSSIVHSKIRADGQKLFLHVQYSGKVVFEISLVSPGSSSAMFIEANKDQPEVSVAGFHLKVARPETLLLIKRSHVHLPIKWDKNIADYHFLKKRISLENASELELAAFQRRVEETNARAEDRINLNMRNEEFFGKSEGTLSRFYHHDDLHAVTCYYERPLYESAKIDTDKALIPKSKWDELSHIDKVRMVREECFAIALERVIIPKIEKGDKYSADEAFGYALKRVSTTLTKGWFRDFAIENHPEIRQNDRDFERLFLEAVKSKRIVRK